MDTSGAAYRPKALKMCDEQADGFILQFTDPQITAWTVAVMHRAALKAGRDPDEFYICVAALAYVGRDLAQLRDQCRWSGGMAGNHVAALMERYGVSGVEDLDGAGEASTAAALGTFVFAVISSSEYALLHRKGRLDRRPFRSRACPRYRVLVRLGHVIRNARA